MVAKNTDYTTVDDYRESIRSELEKKRKRNLRRRFLRILHGVTVLEEL